MIALSTQKDFRRVRDLLFCYLCGKAIEPEDQTDHDHVPSEKVFDQPDRNFPLKLITHKDPCHSSLNLDDEVVGQLISLLHGKHSAKRDDRLKIGVIRDTDNNPVTGTFCERRLEPLIFRWIRGFHTALYLKPLPENTPRHVQTPFPYGEIRAGKIVEQPIPEQHYLFVEVIKRNRASGNIDCLTCNNGRLKYECVWDQFSDGNWACIFALDLYGWINLGDGKNFRPRGCVGFYMAPEGKAPAGASVASNLEIIFANTESTNPFGL